MSFKTKPKAPKGPQKTKQAALAAARTAYGKMAVEGIDFQLRNTGAGWVHEPMPEATVAPKKPRAKKAATKITDGLKEAVAVSKGTAKPARTTKVKVENGVATKVSVSPGPDGPTSAPGAASDAKKTDTFVAMLKTPAGATSKQLEEAMVWKPHSVRGLLGTLRKRGVDVVSTKVKGSPTVYSIAAEADPGEVI